MSLVTFLVICCTIIFLICYRIIITNKKYIKQEAINDLIIIGTIGSSLNRPIGLKQLRLIIAGLISLVLLISSLYIILSGKFSGDDKCWAASCISAIVAFWLKP